MPNEAEQAADETRLSKPQDREYDEMIDEIKSSVQDTQCRERYNFGADNVVLTTSGEEWTYGKYVYHHQEGSTHCAITTAL